MASQGHLHGAGASRRLAPFLPLRKRSACGASSARLGWREVSRVVCWGGAVYFWCDEITVTDTSFRKYHLSHTTTAQRVLFWPLYGNS